MRPTFLLQITLILIMAGLTAFIFFHGKDKSEALTKEDRFVTKDTTNQSAPEKAAATDFQFSSYKDKVIKTLPDTQAQRIKELEKALNKGSRDSTLIPKISHFWSHQDRPLIAAEYHKKWAQRKNDTQSWFKVGQQYQKAREIRRDTNISKYATENAVKAFKRVLEIDPNHLNAKAGLALAYIKERRQVMKGVGLLKEVLKVNPEHRKALFYLGVLSIRSGQFDKALERFQKLVRIQPKNAFNHRYLGIIQEQLGNTKKAIDAYSTYKEMVEQPKLKERAKSKINTLKKK